MDAFHGYFPLALDKGSSCCLLDAIATYANAFTHELASAHNPESNSHPWVKTLQKFQKSCHNNSAYQNSWLNPSLFNKTRCDILLFHMYLSSLWLLLTIHWNISLVSFLELTRLHLLLLTTRTLYLSRNFTLIHNINTYLWGIKYQSSAWSTFYSLFSMWKKLLKLRKFLKNEKKITNSQHLLRCWTEINLVRLIWADCFQTWP